MIFSHVDFPTIIVFLPAYYQACTGVSTIRAGVLLLAFSGAIGPITILGGASVTIFKRYRPQLWIGWTFLITGLGLLSTLDANASLAKQVAFPPVLALGTGLIFAVVCFPVLAPTPIDQNAHALTLFAFVRSFATVCMKSIHHIILSYENIVSF